MSSADPIPRIAVPGQRTALSPPDPARVRALKRHLIESIRDLAAARRPERLIQKRTPEPEGFAARVVAAGCGHCRGSCCMAGGTHAFIDERTMARVRRENPEMGARAAVRAYVDAVAPRSFRGSCLFHGASGCTLPRGLRAELCNSYCCDGLATFLKASPDTVGAVRIVTHDGEETLFK